MPLLTHTPRIPSHHTHTHTQHTRTILEEEKKNYAAAVARRDEELTKYKAGLTKIEEDIRAKAEATSRFYAEKKEREDLAMRVTSLTNLKLALEMYNASSGEGGMSPEQVVKALSESLNSIDNQKESLGTVDQNTLSVAAEIDELQKTVGSADDGALEEEKEDAIDDLLDEIEEQQEMYLWVKGERDRIAKSTEADDDEIDF